MCRKSLLQTKGCLLFIMIFGCVSLWIANKALEQNFSRALFKVIPRSFSSRMAERRQLLREQCLTKPPNPSFIEEADFSRFIVIEKLKFVFCFIPKVSCTTWKRVLYSAENKGGQVVFNPHNNRLFSWLKDYSVTERKKILKGYYKAMFVREPFERLASAYRDKVNRLWFKRFVIPDKTTEELRKEAAVPFSTFIKSVLSSNATTLPKRGYIEDQHWRSYEQICPCEVDYDFIGHFENLAEEAPQLLKIIGVDDYVTFPEYRLSKTKSHVLEYYSELTKDEIFQLGRLFELDFKLFGYDFPGPLEEICEKKSLTTEN